MFEAFLRPEGNTSSDTLAGRTSLDAFDQSMSVYDENTEPLQVDLKEHQRREICPFPD